ncbi:hypothetical protein SDC9_161737 [bioreactor metagenome]|uniref:N-acetyltransferase domain-containing protein n=1 Tax=bioreactor metagenome TaxID=1076179 RepID=A0A645FKB9_9ZZZZ
MSCRVLKRGMEEFIINSIVTLAQTHGYSKISAEYIPTAKNLMVKDIYPEMGFTIIGENKYTMDVKDYQLHKTFITKE